jgi:hypothetical protein
MIRRILPCLMALGLMAQVPLLQQADEACYQHRVAEARQLWERAVQTLPKGPDRAAAHLRLANLAWRVYGQAREARQHLKEAGDDGLPLAELAREELRIALWEGKGGEAWACYRRAPSAPLAIRLGMACLQVRLPDEVATCQEAIDRFLAEQPLDRVALQAKLRLALRSGQWRSLLQAWRALLGTEQLPAIANAGKRLASLLERRGDPDQLAVCLALAQSRLYPEAGWVASRLQARTETAEIRAYADFLGEVSQLSQDHYALCARGGGDRAALVTSFGAACGRLAARLTWAPGTEPQPGEAGWPRLQEALGARFGTFATLGVTGGVFDLHMGHVIRDERLPIRQYGRSAPDYRLITLDFEVSNGFESWLWDGRAAHGGWSRPEGMYRWATSPNLGRRLWESLQAGLPSEEKDLAAAQRTPIAFFPSLRARLERRGAEALRASLGTQPSREAFDRASEENAFRTAFVAHEGRHALDRGAWWRRLLLNASDLETRAKLSEIAFAPHPHLAFGGILDLNVGDATPHGQANLRVLRGLADWVSRHRTEVRGYRAEVPPLFNLSALSEEQLRQAARSLDPWSR